MTIEELIADIESLVPCKEGLPTALCQTREEYIVFRSCGIEETEGHACKQPMICNTEAEAVIALHRHIVAYLHGKRGTLYWRTRPAVEHFEALRSYNKYGLPPRPSGYSARARLIMTDKPVIWATIADREHATNEQVN